MSQRKTSYHHGDLRAALLTVAEEVLTESGMEGFSLRAVAKRAGVSHAAPAHHYGDAIGLLTALATEGFRRFIAAQRRREEAAPEDPRERLVAAGLGYIDFALANPALFRLMFSSTRPQFEDEELSRVAQDAYDRLIESNAAAAQAAGQEPDYSYVAGTWAIAHGLADLLAAGRLKGVQEMDAAKRDAFLAGIIRRNVPAD